MSKENYLVIDPRKVRPVAQEEFRAAKPDFEVMFEFEPTPRKIDLTKFDFSVKVDKKDKSALVISWKPKKKKRRK